MAGWRGVDAADPRYGIHSLARQVQVLRVKRDRLLDVLVPIGPLVATAELFIFVGDVQGLQVLVERPVLVEQEIAGPAVDPQGRDPAVIDGLREAERVVGASLVFFAEDALELGAEGPAR